MDTKVVITGIGVVSPVGNTINDFWESLCNGRSGIRRVDDVFDASRLSVKIAGIAPDFEPKNIPPKDLRRYDRFSLCAIEAADQAWAQSGLDIEKEDPFRVGCLIGTGIGGIATIDENTVKNHEGGPRRISPLMVPTGISNMAAGHVAMRFGAQGPNKCTVSACASSTHALGDAADQIRLGKAEVMIAGGTESTIFEFGLGAFAAMRALTASHNDDPERASRPFDLDRDGFVMGEGAGIMILESEEHALARGADILGVVAGMGETCDAYHITAPRPDGSGGAQAMRNALNQAKLNKEQVGYYNAHGTSTKLNEIGETLSLKAVFGDDMPPVSSTKSMTGHLLGGAGAIEALICLLAIRTGVMPPNINYDTPDPECMVNIIANVAREGKVDIAMSNSLGFGGHNACIVIQKYDA